MFMKKYMNIGFNKIVTKVFIASEMSASVNLERSSLKRNLSDSEMIAINTAAAVAASGGGGGPNGPHVSPRTLQQHLSGSQQVTGGVSSLQVLGAGGGQESLPSSPIESVTSTDDDVINGSLGEAGPKKLKNQRNRTAYTQQQIDALEKGEL